MNKTRTIEYLFFIGLIFFLALAGVSALTIGGQRGDYNGTIDEVRIWNRSFSAAEAQQSYFSNLNKYDSDKWTLYVNQSKSTLEGLIDGIYTYFASATDETGNENLTETRIITIAANDFSPPNVTINTPENTTYTTVSITFNITATDETAISACLYSLDSGGTNWTMSNLGDEWTATNSSMTQGSHTAEFYCNDTLNYLNDTESVSFFIDSVAPEISVVYPENTTYSSNRTELNYTYGGVGVDSCWYSLDSGATNISITCGNNVTGISSDDGSNTWTVYINDTAGNENLSSVTFYISSVPPSAYKFAVKNSSGDNIASIDDTGSMFLAGSVYESQGSLNPGANSFIIRDSSATDVAYFNSSGSLLLLGTVSASAAMSPVGYNLEIRNSTGSVVAYFDDEGNLNLKGLSIENYASP